MTTEKEIIGKVKQGYQRPHGHKVYQNELLKWFYIVPKHAPFLKFGEYYMKDPLMLGESLNKEALLSALEKKATLVFVYARHIYTIESEEFYKWSFENNTYRLQYAGERTYSVPQHLMKKYERTFD